MAGSTIIGRVGVKVIPDTSDFKRDAEQKLNALEKGLKLNIPVKFNDAGLRSDMINTLRTINAENKAMDSRKIRFQATIGSDGMGDAVREARRKLQALADADKIKFNADVVAKGAATVQLQLDRKSLDDVKDQIERWEKDVSPVIIDVQLDLSGASVARVRGLLAALFRRQEVRVVPTLDQAAAARVAAGLAALSGARVASQWFDRFDRWISNLDKNAGLLTSVGTAIAGISAAGLAASSNILTLAGGLASIAPAALALPGILGGMAIGIGTTVAAMKDFNTVFPEVSKSLSKLQNLISKNFWDEAKKPFAEMIETILPTLTRGLDRVSSQLGGFFGGLASGVTKILNTKLDVMFEDLRESIEIATGATGAMVGIISTLGQVGAGYLPQLARWFVDITTKFNDFLTAAHEDGRLEQWIDTGVQALKELGNVVKQVARIFHGLYTAASDAGGSTLKTLGDALQKIADVIKTPEFQYGLTRVFEAAHVAMQTIAQTSGPAVKAFFLSMGGVLEKILPLAGEAIGALLAAVALALSDPIFTDGIISLFESIAKAAKSLAPAFGPIAQVIGTVAGAFGTFLESLTPVISAMVQALAPAFITIIEAVEPLIPILGAALANAFQILAPVIATVAQAFADFIANGALPAIQAAIVALLPVIAELAPIIGDVLVQALQALTPILPVLVDAFTQITPYIPKIAQGFADMVVAALPLIPALLDLVVAITPMIPPLLDLAVKIIPILIAVVEGAVKTFQSWVDGIKKGIQWYKDLEASLEKLVTTIREKWDKAVAETKTKWSEFVDSVKSKWDAFASFFTQDWGQVWENAKTNAKNKWNGIKTDISTKLSEIKTNLVAKWQEMKTNISTKLGEIKTDAATRWGEIKTGIATKLSEIKTDITTKWGEMKTSISTKLGEIKTDISTKAGEWKTSITTKVGEMKTAMSTAWGEMKSTISEKFSEMTTVIGTKVGEAVAKVRELPGKIKGALGDLGGLLVSAGRQVIDGFIKGITSGFDTVRNKLSSLTSMLPDWKGPPSTDKKILTNAGQLVIQSFIDGLESQYDAVKDSLGGLGKDLSGMTLGSPNAHMNVSAGLSGRVDGAQSDGPSVSKTLNYYAAAGSSLGSEEDLFAAASRTRMVGW